MRPPENSNLSLTKIVFIMIPCLLIGFSLSFIVLETLPGHDIAKAMSLFDQSPSIPVEAEKPKIIVPSISSLDPKNNLIPGDTIHILFNTPMATTSSPVSSATATSTEGMWLNDTSYDLTLKDIKADETYTIELLPGVLSAKGVMIAKEENYQVTTAPAPVPSIMIPNKKIGIISPIEVIFDQAVEHESAEKAFSVKPNVKGNFTWEENHMTFTPTRLDYQTTYSAKESAGVQATRGFQSSATSSISFTTDAEIFKLNVPYFQQQYANSCEAAALRMALAFYGVSASDIDIVQKFGYKPIAKDVTNNIWDDPQEMFVGSIENSNDISGYGVYGTPVAAAARSFGRNVVYTRSITSEFLAEEIKKRHPILIWGYTSLENPPYTWTTPKGSTVKAFRGEHVRVIVGVEGKASNPLGFYLHDPINGNQYEYWSVQKLMGQVNSVAGVTDQAVVVQ